MQELGGLYREIVESAADGIWIFDMDGVTRYANTSMSAILGRSRDEMAGLSMYVCLDELGQGQFAEHLEDLRARRVNVNEVEVQLIRKDGSPVWCVVNENPLYAESGEFLGYVHRVSDNTQQRQLVEELTRSRGALAEAQRIAKVGSWDWDLVNNTVSCSQGLYDLYRLDAQDHLASYDTFLERVCERDRARIEALLSHALTHDDSFEFDVRIARGDGSYITTRDRGLITRAADGRSVRVTGTSQDITDAAMAEQALKASVDQNKLLQTLTSAANEADTLVEALAEAQQAIVQYDDWYRARAFMPDAERPGLVVPLYISDAERDEDAGLPPPMLAAEQQLACQCLDTGTMAWDESDPENATVAFPILIRDVVVAVGVIVANQPFVQHGLIRRMIDQIAAQLGRVAERERMVVELSRARDDAMTASRHKSDFLATMSHEIRTPMNGVIGLNELLLQTTLDEHQRRLAEGVQGAGDALLSVIDDILDFSKIEAGELRLERVPFDVRQIVDQVTGLLAQQVKAQGITLDTACADDVPTLLTGDPTRFSQVLTNLVSNAVKFTADGGVHVQVAVHHRSTSATHLRVDVHDTGRGIEPALQTSLFEPFTQADLSTTREYGGTGLGLAIARHLVAALGGEIGVTSTSGVGSTFWFTSRFLAADEGAQPEAAPTAAPRSTRPGRRGCVLVVEDNDINQLVAVGLLESLGFSVDLADDGAEGARRAVAGEYDAVLMDVQMPTLDGYAATRRIRAAEGDRRVPIIAMTAGVVAGDRERCLTIGMDDFVTKPVDAKVLDEVLARWVVGNPAPAPGPEEPAGPATTVDCECPGAEMVLDRPRVDALRELDEPGGVSYFAMVVERFLGRDHAAPIRAALEQRSASELDAAAHRLKGNSLNLGLVELGGVAGLLEDLGREGDLPAAARLVPRLDVAITRAVTALGELT